MSILVTRTTYRVTYHSLLFQILRRSFPWVVEPSTFPPAFCNIPQYFHLERIHPTPSALPNRSNIIGNPPAILSNISTRSWGGGSRLPADFHVSFDIHFHRSTAACFRKNSVIYWSARDEAVPRWGGTSALSHPSIASHGWLSFFFYFSWKSRGNGQVIKGRREINVDPAPRLLSLIARQRVRSPYFFLFAARPFCVSKDDLMG